MIKPLDVAGIAAAVQATAGRAVVVEDHHPEGGLGEAVSTALADAGATVHLAHLAVRCVPSSGQADELIREAGISPVHIANAATCLLGTGTRLIGG